MPVKRWLSPCLILLALVAGCGGDLVKAKGKLLKDGKPFVPGEKEAVRIVFVPVDRVEGKEQNMYPAEFKPEDGTFKVVGSTGTGLPPGKYRVAIELARGKDRVDVLKGKFAPGNSPIVREVKNSSDVLVIDLDNPND
jgi:hypothetical protein